MGSHPIPAAVWREKKLCVGRGGGGVILLGTFTAFPHDSMKKFPPSVGRKSINIIGGVPRKKKYTLGENKVILKFGRIYM
jgi:hypothetical protein